MAVDGAAVTEAETARLLYDRVRRDSGGRMAPYRAVLFVAQLMKRDPLTVLHAIGDLRVAKDDDAFTAGTPRQS